MKQKLSGIRISTLDCGSIGLGTVAYRGYDQMPNVGWGWALGTRGVLRKALAGEGDVGAEGKRARCGNKARARARATNDCWARCGHAEGELCLDWAVGHGMDGVSSV